MSDNLTMSDLLRQVPEGEERLFASKASCEGENQYLAVYQNTEYFPWPEWNNGLPLEQAPWAGSRKKERIPISVLPEPDVSFAGKSAKMADFYKTGCQAYFLSDRLVSLILDLDPESIDHRPIIIRAEDRNVNFNVAMARRNIEAVDVERTNILIKDYDYSGHYLRKIRFPDAVNFKAEKLSGVLSFTDIDVAGWFWSRELIETAKKAGITGLYTAPPGSISSKAIDRL